MVAEAISHYRIIRKLGAGGMGEVYLAEDTRLDRKVALKVLPAKSIKEEERLRRFFQEARAASALNHPNIITIYDIGQADGIHFIATEFVDGQTLRQRMAGGKLKLREILDIAIQIAEALSAAHQSGIIHRDIKPENVMLRRDGYVKVLDFGIAKLMEASGEQQLESENKEHNAATTALVKTDSNIVMGSPSYMSPEQARGLTVDARTDIFSLGVVLYEVMAGMRPFEGATSGDVIVSILHHQPPPLGRFSEDIPEPLERIVMKALSKEREQRYQTAEEMLGDLLALKQRVDYAVEAKGSFETRPILTGKAAQAALATTEELAVKSGEIAGGRATSRIGRFFTEIGRHKMALGAVAVVVALATAAMFMNRDKAQPLNERDGVLVADFANMTGDPVFDGTLKQALAVQLEQSPFLHIFSDERVREALRYMNRSPEERLTTAVAREVCQRQGLKALLTGAISSLGNHYVISLEAMNAYTGDVIAREQVEAESKEQVLRSLGAAASKLRERLGESLPMIGKFDAPIEQATTSSLEALKAFALGNEQQNQAKYLEAIPFYRRAIELDPNFALAYTRLAVACDNSRQPGLAAEYAEKAFALRERVSERERLFISWRYYSIVTRELDKAIETLELWKQTYPRDVEPPNTLANSYIQVGQYERAVEEAQEAIRLNPTRPQPYANWGLALICLNRFDEARQVYERALAQGLDSTSLRWGLYLVALSREDAAAMGQQLGWIAGRPNEYEALDWQAKTATFYGQMRKAQEYSIRAIDLVKRGNLNGPAAQYLARAALREAAAGNCRQVKQSISQALSMARRSSALVEGALALALCGEVGQAQSLIEEQARRFPKDTLLNTIWLPTVRAVIELNRNNPDQAIQLLQATSRYEMGQAAGFWPVYVRGQAYLRQRNGAAAAEFQKITNARGINVNSNLYPLAHLGAARAAALTGDVAKSRKAYEEFFHLWKDADPDIRVLQEARQEYGKLK
ncbi:MAG TPA: protein kinase [Blastocatellia bacterium]|nr:protein kinase [Blastocatellia bacterium]